ncbi:GNAT family N-acetyltransferase [Flavobacterium qiangtangense]|uniref:GNAT family N-acetyltransferase n=1 Tax=Flavobacterium qiangtangense TaxID=1442595 RepID=A0ABW1PSI7_9FLAO
MLHLEPFNEIYLSKSWNWLNDPEIKFLTATPDFTQVDQLEWFNRIQNNSKYAVFGVKYNDQEIGVFGFKNVDLINSEAEYFGYIGEKKYIGLKLGAEVLSMIINYGKYELKLQKISLRVIPDNFRAIALYKKFGFSEIDMVDNKILMTKTLSLIEIERYSSDHSTAWNEFILSSKNGLFLFDRNYMDYHDHKFPDHSLVFRKKQKIVAVFPATANGNKIFSHSGLTFGSLIMDNSLRQIEVLACFQEMKSYYKLNGFEEIIYKAIPSIFHAYPAEEDLYALFKNDAKLYRRDISSVVQIDNKIRFSESKRQSVRKCSELKVSIEENSDFSGYWELLKEVLNKFDAKPVHTLEEITLLKSKFPVKIRLFEARLDEKLLAGAVIYDFGDVVHTQYMANSIIGRKIGALDYLNYVLITEVFKDKKYYSFGMSTVDQGRILNEGLILQKEMMGGRGIALDFYSINL